MGNGTVITGSGDSRQEWNVTLKDFRDSGSPELVETQSWDGEQGDWVAYSQEYDSKFPSGSYGHIDVRGPKKSAVLSVHGHAKGGTLRKFGFREYTTSGGAPKYFLQETASGGFPGCASTNAPSKTYSGNQRYEFGQWGPTYRQNFSNDVWNTPYATRSGGKTWKRWPGEGTTDYPLVESPTMREWVDTSDCDNKPIKDRIRFDLSDELTLSRMKQFVEAKFERDRWNQHRWPGLWNSEGAILFTSKDEGLFIHQKYYYHLNLSIPEGYPFSTGETLSLDFKYRILRLNIATMRVSESTETLTVDFRNGRPKRFPENEDEFLELRANEGEFAVIRPAPAIDQPRKDFFCHPSPIAFFKNQPRMMGRSRTVPIEPQWSNSDQFEEARSE
jgi:hypothetical protein